MYYGRKYLFDLGSGAAPTADAHIRADRRVAQSPVIHLLRADRISDTAMRAQETGAAGRCHGS